MKSYYRLIVPNGEYTSDNIIHLLYIVIKHRIKHLLREGRWID